LAVKAILTEVRVVLRQTTIPQMCLLVWQKTNIYWTQKPLHIEGSCCEEFTKALGEHGGLGGIYLSLSRFISYWSGSPCYFICWKPPVRLPHCISSNSQFKLENTDSTSFC